MNPSAASSSTLSGASVQTAKGNKFTTTGGDVVRVEQNVKLTVHPCCTPGDNTSEVRKNARSGPIATTNIFDTLATLLGRILRPKSSEANLSSNENISQQSAPNYDARNHSEPRATVTEITDNMMASGSLSVLDTSNSTTSSLTQSSFSERYIRSMLKCNEGYPLYEPDPENQEGVRVGDVGLVTEDGGFDFLFNVCPPQDISTNSAGLPDDFEMLRSPETLIRTHFQSDSRLFSYGVTRTAEPDVKYTCSGPEGGVLELPSGATRFGAKDKLSFKELGIRHAENWYRYTILTRRRDAPNGSLYIVTSCIKCTDWGIAVFDRPSNTQDYLRFIPNEENQIRQSKYKWTGSGACMKKVVPNRGGAGSNDANGPNQCIFLRGYKIMLRKDIWKSIANTQLAGTSSVTVSPYRSHSGNRFESPRQGDSSNQDYSSQSSPGSGCGTTRVAQNTSSRMDMSARVILYEYSKTSPAHPSDLINAMLLCQEPNAKVALTHDDDWCDLLQYHSRILDSEAFKNVSLPYTSNVDEYDCVSLKRSDLDPSPNVTVVESSSDSRVPPTPANRLPIDNTTTIPTLNIPSRCDDLALVQQDDPHTFNSTTRFSTPHSQTCHYQISSTTATVGSDVNYAFACEDEGVDDHVMSLPPFGSSMHSGAEPSAATMLTDLPTSYREQDQWHLFNAMTRISTPYSQTSHSLISSTTTTADNDFNCAFAHGDVGVGAGVMSLAPFDSFMHGGAGPSAPTTLPNLSTPYVEQDPWQLATQFSAPHSNHPQSFTPAKADSDVNCAFAHEDVEVDVGVMSLPSFNSFIHGVAEPSATTTLPNLPYMEQDHRQLSNITTQFSVPHSQTSHHPKSFTAATADSDVNHAFAHEDMEVDAGVMSRPPFGSFLHGGAEPSAATTLPNLPYMEQDHRNQLFNATTQFSVPHSQTSHHPKSFITPSDVNRAFAWQPPSLQKIFLDSYLAGLGDLISDSTDSPMTEDEEDEVPDLDEIPRYDLADIEWADIKLASVANTLPFSLGQNLWPFLSSSTFNLSGASVETAEGNNFLNVGRNKVINHCATGDSTSEVRGGASSDQNPWPFLIPSNGVAGPSTTSTATDQSDQSPVVTPAKDEPQAFGSQRIQQAVGKRRQKEAIHRCPFSNVGCQATFTSRHNLRYHINAHLGLKPHKCNKCTYTAASPATLKRHQERCEGTSHPTEEHVIPQPF